MNMKTKSENMRLFDEARALKESIRIGLHRKATNGSFVDVKSSGIDLFKRADLSAKKKSDK